MDYLTVKFADMFNDSSRMSAGWDYYQFANWLRDDESDHRQNLSLGRPGQWSFTTPSNTDIVRSITFVSEKDANEEMIFNAGTPNEFKLKSGESYGDNTSTYAKIITEALRGTALINHLDGRQYKLNCQSILQGPKMNSWSRYPTFEQAKSSFQPKIAELGLQKVDDLQKIDGGDLVIDSVLFAVAETREDGSMKVGFSNADKPYFVEFYYIDYCWYVKPSDYKHYNLTFLGSNDIIQADAEKYTLSTDSWMKDPGFEAQLWPSAGSDWVGNETLQHGWGNNNNFPKGYVKDMNWWFKSSINNGTEPLNLPFTLNQASANTAELDFTTYTRESFSNLTNGIVGEEMFQSHVWSQMTYDRIAGYSTKPTENLPEKIKIVYYGPAEGSDLYQVPIEAIIVYDNTGSNKLLSEKIYYDSQADYITKNSNVYLISDTNEYEVTFEAKERVLVDGIHPDYNLTDGITSDQKFEIQVGLTIDDRYIHNSTMGLYQIEPTACQIGVPKKVRGANLSMGSPFIYREWNGKSSTIQLNNPLSPTGSQGLFCGTSMLSDTVNQEQNVKEAIQIFRTKMWVGTSSEKEVLNFYIHDISNPVQTNEEAVAKNKRLLCGLIVDHHTKKLIRSDGGPVNLNGGVWGIKELIYRQDPNFFGMEKAPLAICGTRFFPTDDNTPQDPGNWGYVSFGEKMWQAVVNGGDDFQLFTNNQNYNAPANFFMGSHVLDPQTKDELIAELDAMNYNETNGWIDYRNITTSTNQQNNPAESLANSLRIQCQQLSDYSVKVTFLAEKDILSEYVIASGNESQPPLVLASNSNRTFKIEDTLEYEINFQSLNSTGAFNNNVPDFLSLSVGHSQNIDQFKNLYANYPSLDFSNKEIKQDTPTKVPGAMISQGLYKFKMNHGKVEYFLNVIKNN